MGGLLSGMLQKNKGYLLVFSTALISGFSIFINKFGVSVANPYVFTFLKNAVVAMLLCAVIFTIKDFQLFKALNKKQWGLLALIGIIGGGIPFLLFFKGLSMTSAAGAAFVHKAMFVWIFILAAIFLKEKISRNYYLAGILILGGNALLLKLSSISFDSGMLLVFLATIFWAAENVISKYALREMPPRIVMWARMFFGSIVILTFIIFSSQAALLIRLNLQQAGWGLVTGLVLFSYVATWYSGIKYIQISEAAVILALGAPITILLNAVFSSPVSGKEYLSAFLISLGVAAVLGADKLMRKTKQSNFNNNSAA